MKGLISCTPRLRLMVNSMSAMLKYMFKLRSGMPTNIYLNSRYNRVILHAVYFDDDDFNLRTRLQNGKRIPTLELLKWVAANTGDLYDDIQRIQTTEEGICRVTGKPLNMEVLKGVFESLGRERFLRKGGVNASVKDAGSTSSNSFMKVSWRHSDMSGIASRSASWHNTFHSQISTRNPS